MGRMTAAEIMPGKLYQRGNFLSASRADKDKLVERYGITVIVNLWAKTDAEVASDSRLLYLQWPLRSTNLPDGFSLMIDFLVQLINEGHVVLVHCEAGVNRSVWVCAMMMTKLRGYNGHQAEAFVKGKVRRAKINRQLLEELHGITASNS